MKFCVIGLGRLGYQVAVGLEKNGQEVMAIDSNQSIIASIKDRVTLAICMNVTDEESLRNVGVEEMDTVIVAIGESLAQSILITALLKKKLHIPHVVTRAVNTIHKEILQLIGADDVVIPEKEVGIRLADSLSSPFKNLIHLTKEFGISILDTPESFVGKKVVELDLYKKYQVYCFGIQKNEIIETINPEYVISENDILVFSGLNTDLEKITRL